MKQLQLSGYAIELKKEIGESRYQIMSNHLKAETGYSIEELEQGITIVKMDFSCAMQHILTGLRGCYIHGSKQLWLHNTENSETIIHEFVHVAQWRRKGIINAFQKRLTSFANIMANNGFRFFYNCDYYEREARNIAKKYLQVNNINED